MTLCHLSKQGLVRGALAALLAWSAVAGCGDVTLPERPPDAATSPVGDAAPGQPSDPAPDARPTIDAGPAPDASLACIDVDLGSAFGSPIQTGDTTDGPDRSQSCDGGDDLGDVFFLWTAPSTGRFRFDTCGSTFDTMLTAREADCSGSQIDCNDDSNACNSMDGLESRLLLDLQQGQQIILILDGFDSEGPYQLNIEAR